MDGHLGSGGTDDRRRPPDRARPGAVWTFISFTSPGPAGEETVAGNRKHAVAYAKMLRPSEDRRSNDRYWERNCVPCVEVEDGHGKWMPGKTLLGPTPLG